MVLGSFRMPTSVSGCLRGFQGCASWGSRSVQGCQGVSGAFPGELNGSLSGVLREFSGVALEFFGNVLWESQGVSRGVRELRGAQKVSRSLQGISAGLQGASETHEVQESFQWRLWRYQVVSVGVLREVLRGVAGDLRGFQGLSHGRSRESMSFRLSKEF